MELRVRLFGALTERAGCSSVEIEDAASASEVARLVGERYPSLVPLLGTAKVAVNHEVVPDDRKIGPADEVALLPPMSGGAAKVTVELCERPDESEALSAVSVPEAGGTVVFCGTVRSSSEAGEVERLDYSAYEDMAVKVMSQIAAEATEKWGLCAVAIRHATGSMSVGEVTFIVACSAPHRAEAFDACRYAVDEVKARVPVWKKEIGPWGERWIEN